MSYCKHAGLLNGSSKYFSIKLLRNVHELNSKRTDRPFGSWQLSFYLRLRESNNKTDFFATNKSKANFSTCKDFAIAYSC